MDFLKINENLTKASKFLCESNDYKLDIITNRGRGEDGFLRHYKINRNNDLEALLYVFENFDLQNAGMFNGEYEDDDLDEDDKQLKERILNCVKENKIEEGVKLLTDLYFDNFDISDYYDDIVKLEAPDGHIVIEDDIDVEEWFGDDYKDEEEEEDYEEDTFNSLGNFGLIHIMLTHLEVLNKIKLFIIDKDIDKNTTTCNLSLKKNGTFKDVVAQITVYNNQPEDTAFTINLYLDGENKQLHQTSMDNIKQAIIDNWKDLRKHNKNK